MKIVFMGTPDAAVSSLSKCLSDGHEVVAVYTQPDRPSGRGNKITFSPVKEFALINKIPVYQPVKIKISETLETFRSHLADLAVVVAYGRILPETYLTAFSGGAINVHFSLLPKYRGAAPVNWAIVNGEAETGVTTIQMDSGLDTGAILMQKSTDIGGGETAIDLMARLSLIGADVLSETLSGLAGIIPMPQNHVAATLAPIMNREDGAIEWRITATEISNRIRGFQPFPTAFSKYRQSKLTVWRAFAASENNPGGGRPGEILEAHGDDLTICCGDNSTLQIHEIQLEGKKRMAVRDFINGSKPQKGEVLGA